MRAEIAEILNRREIYRYLGYRGIEPDETIRQMTEEVIAQLMEAIEPRHIYRIFDCGIEGGRVTLYSEDKKNAALTACSEKLASNLERCEKAALMAATIGGGADKLLGRYEVLSMAKASVAQACGAACIEAYCNVLQRGMQRQASRQGFFLRPRFSPGYGDLTLETQKDIFCVLECTKRMGLTLTDSLLMYPTKSVTAFVGWTTNAQTCHIGSCRTCDNIGCEFRDEQ